MWELMGSGSGYKTTYTVTVDETGKPLSAPEEIPGTRLNANDVLRYNEKTGNVHWAVNTPDGKIAVYSLKAGTPGPRRSAGTAGRQQAANSRQQAAEGTNNRPPSYLGFTGSIGMYLNGINENVLSAGVPLQLGLRYRSGDFAVKLLGEAGAGIGVQSFTETGSPLLEWHYGGTAEIYWQRIGFGVGLGGAASTSLNIPGLPTPDPFNTTYARFALIYQNKSKFTVYGQHYGSGNWGLGLQWGRSFGKSFLSL
jgi:hypothetical protein